MSRPSKKQKPNYEPEPSSSSSSSENDSDQEESNKQENIQIDLEARSHVDTDHSAILYFLEQSFGNSIKKSILDPNQLAKQLITQQSFGSVFYQPSDSTTDETDDDDDESPVLGVCSLLPFDQQQNKQIHSWLLDKCSDNGQAKNILHDTRCGLFINERYMNIPAEISLPAIRTLRLEMSFELDYWIVHAKLRLNTSDTSTIYYVNGEEEIFQQYSTLCIDYNPAQSNNNNEWTHRRRIIFVSTNKLDEICSNIEQKLKI
ncbi:unnamed protein product [Rotaria magnacalcarata]|uniref:Uncharacterized protein n=3 Tax=Rotaria magnacalcarata TaxID=392030 RepID=A0A816EJV3_9BILA|nr:unnamed protein product [Rotaria magnacalcarata]CAF4054299.1 unnamed protein product [Rotaria magnacalcarata]